MSVTVALKRCPTCGETKPLSEFHRNHSSNDGRDHYCKPCRIAYVKANQAEQRERMGEDAYLEHRRLITAKSRERRDNDSERRWTRARNAAIRSLIERHRREYDALLALARDELERAAS